MRKAKNCKIPVTKRPNYVIKSNLKFGFIFLKSSTLVSNYIAKLSTKVNPYYESIENFGITLIYITFSFEIPYFLLTRAEKKWWVLL